VLTATPLGPALGVKRGNYVEKCLAGRVLVVAVPGVVGGKEGARARTGEPQRGGFGGGVGPLGKEK
jgi:hypothetical protein